MADAQKSDSASASGVLQTILKAIGVPVIAWLVGANWEPLGDYARKNPAKVLCLLALYETALFIQSLLKGVWNRLESPFLDFCAARLRFFVQTRFRL